MHVEAGGEMICSKISQRECDKFDVLDDMVVSELKSNIVVILSEHVKQNLQKNKHTLADHCHLSFVICMSKNSYAVIIT